MQLRFEPADLTLERARAGFEVVYRALGGTQPLREVSRVDLPDQNPSAPAAYEARHESSDGKQIERVECGEGNPRDGWGYVVTIALEMERPSGLARVQLRSGGWEPRPSDFAVELGGIDGADLAAVRAALVDCFGADADRSALPFVALDNVRSLEARGETGVAVEWAREGARCADIQAYGRAELIDWLAKHAGKGDMALQRLREAPAALGGWLAAVADPPRDWTVDAIRAVIARLCPFDPERWGPDAPWFGHPAWPLGRGEVKGSWFRPRGDPDFVQASLAEQVSVAHTGWRTGGDWQAVMGEEPRGLLPAWRATVRRHARFRDGAVVPTVRVELQAVRRDPADWRLPPSRLLRKPLEERLTWTWLFGGDTGDAVVLTRQEVRGRSGMVEGGRCWCAVGSEGFRQRAAQLLAGVTPIAWVSCSAEDSLGRDVRPAPPWRGLPPGPDLVRALLSATFDQAPDEIVTLVDACACAPGEYCAHRLRLIDIEREWEAVARTAAAPRDAQTARINAAAVAAARCLAFRDDRGLARAAERVDDERWLLSSFRSG